MKRWLSILPVALALALSVMSGVLMVASLVGAPGRADRRFWWGLGMLAVAVALSMFDGARRQR